MKVPDRANESAIELSTGRTIETLNNMNLLRIWEDKPFAPVNFLSFETPEEVDELIEALTYARMLMTHGPGSTIPSAFDGYTGLAYAKKILGGKT